MILALADAQTLLLIGAIHLDSQGHHNTMVGLVLLLAAAALVVGFVGLYRLAPWGAIVTLSTALLLGLALLARVLRPDGDVVGPLLVLSALQVIAPLPMLVSLALKRPLPSLTPRARSLAATVIVVAVALGSLLFLMH